MNTRIKSSPIAEMKSIKLVLITFFITFEYISPIYCDKDVMIQMMKAQFVKAKEMFPKTLKIKELKVEIDGLDMKAKNIELQGLGDFTTEKLDITEKPSVTTIMVYKVLKVKADFTISGKINGKKIKGSGPLKLKIEDLKLEFFVEFVEKSISKLDFKVHKTDKVEFEADGFELDGKKMGKGDFKALIPFFFALFENKTVKDKIKEQLQDVIDTVVKLLG